MKTLRFIYDSSFIETSEINVVDAPEDGWSLDNLSECVDQFFNEHDINPVLVDVFVGNDWLQSPHIEELASSEKHVRNRQIQE